MAKAYNYILLDWDGNLARTLHLWLEAYRIVLAEEGYFPTDKEIGASFGHVTSYFSELGIKNAAEVYARADAIGRQKLPDIELYPDALEVLNYFKDTNKKTALITSSKQENIDPLLEKYDIRHLFDVTITRFDVENQKPHPESIEKALILLDGIKDEAIIIGDSDKDVLAGINSGIDSILFYPPEHELFYELDELRTHNPTYVVHDFRDIMNIIV